MNSPSYSATGEKQDPRQFLTSLGRWRGEGLSDKRAQVASVSSEPDYIVETIGQELCQLILPVTGTLQENLFSKETLGDLKELNIDSSTVQ